MHRNSLILESLFHEKVNTLLIWEENTKFGIFGTLCFVSLECFANGINNNFTLVK